MNNNFNTRIGNSRDLALTRSYRNATSTIADRSPYRGYPKQPSKRMSGAIKGLAVLAAALWAIVGK